LKAASRKGKGPQDVFNPDDAYEKIKALVEAHNV